MKILLTGENGFLGSCVKKNISSKFLYKKKGRYLINLTSPKKIKNFLQKNKPDIIINCAVKADFKTQYSKNMYLVNYYSVKIFTDYCKRFNKKIIQISGTLVHPKKKIYSFKTLTKPTNYYAKTKLLADKYIIKQNPNYSIIRFGGIYGKRGPEHLFLNKILNSKKKNHIFSGDIEMKRNYIEVNDAAKNIIKLIKIKKNKVYYSGGEVISFKKMFKIISKKTKKNFKFLKSQAGLDEIVYNDKSLKYKKFGFYLNR